MSSLRRPSNVDIWAPVKTIAEQNVPDRFELFILDPGEQKIETKEETSTCPSCPASFLLG